MRRGASSAVAIALAVLLVCVGFVIGHETSTQPVTQAPASLARTVLDYATPWTPTATLSSHERVLQRVSGSCWIGSIAVDDSHAWRCLSRDGLYDPCFSPYAYQPTEVACLASPWSGVVLLHLTKPLPVRTANPPATGGAPPAEWALVLSNGDRCIVITGTVTLLGGVRLAYYCSSGALAGALNSGVEPWTVEYYRPESGRIVEEDVRTAWGG